MRFFQLNNISRMNFWKINLKKNNVSSIFAIFANIIEMCEIDTC